MKNKPGLLRTELITSQDTGGCECLEQLLASQEHSTDITFKIQVSHKMDVKTTGFLCCEPFPNLQKYKLGKKYGLCIPESPSG